MEAKAEDRDDVVAEIEHLMLGRTVPSWAHRAVQEIKRLRAEVSDLSEDRGRLVRRLLELEAAPLHSEPALRPTDCSAGIRDKIRQLSVTAQLLNRAQRHPLVLEIMADCADCIDTENEATYDPEAFDGEPYDGKRWTEEAAELRAKAAAIRAEDPEIWDAPQPAHVTFYVDSQAANETMSAIRAAIAAQVPQWQPIETAPKDGTRIELLGENGKLDVGEWCEYHDGSGGEFSTDLGEGPHVKWRHVTAAPKGGE